MIYSKELRLGNYVRIRDYILCVKAISNTLSLGNNITSDFIHDNFNPVDVNPIELTPEILEKCGFESGRDDLGGIMIYYNYGEFRITYWKGAYCNCLGKEVKYLHQVQNLVFYLIGEELNIQI